MLTEAKIKGLRKSLRSGVPDGEIRNEMARDGYSEEEINRVFAPHKPDMRSWYLSLVLFFGDRCFVFLTRAGILFFVFSAAMFLQYYLQVKKINEHDDQFSRKQTFLAGEIRVVLSQSIQAHRQGS